MQAGHETSIAGVFAANISLVDPSLFALKYAHASDTVRFFDMGLASFSFFENNVHIYPVVSGGSVNSRFTVP